MPITYPRLETYPSILLIQINPGNLCYLIRFPRKVFIESILTMATFSQVLNSIVFKICVEMVNLTLRPLLMAKCPDRSAVIDISYSSIDTESNIHISVTAVMIAFQRPFRALVDNLPELRIILPNLQHLVQHIRILYITCNCHIITHIMIINIIRGLTLH